MNDTQKSDGTFVIRLDYSKSFEKMVDEGQYNNRKVGICKTNFSTKGKGLLRLHVIPCFLGNIVNSPIQVLTIIKKSNLADWNLAGIEHLLAFGAQFPKEQIKYPIYAFGAVGRAYHRNQFPFIGVEGLDRFIALSEENAVLCNHDQRILIVKTFNRP